MAHTTLAALLSHIRSNPSALLAEETLTTLRCYVEGYCEGLADLGIEGDYGGVRAALDEWLAKKYQCRLSIGWDKIVLLQVTPNEGELQRFWSEWDKFYADEGAGASASRMGTR